MMDLVKEYENIGLTGMDELVKKPFKQVTQDLFKWIRERNYDNFSQYIGLLKTELKKFKETEQPQEQDEEFYYEEDEEEEQKAATESELKNPMIYINRLASQRDARTKETLMHLAMANVVNHQDLRFITQLLEIDFPLYKQDANGVPPGFFMTLIQDDKMFEQCFKLFQKRNFSIAQKNKKGLCFLEQLCTYNKINPVRIKIVLREYPKGLSREDHERCY